MGTVAYDAKGKIAFLTIQSPPANALSRALLNDLNQRLDLIEQDPNIKSVILKGDGRFFSAGANIKEFIALQNESDYASLSIFGQKIFDRIEHFPIPVIAAIHGAALGGGLELAMACHIRLVTESTKLGLPEITLGIIPGFAGTQRMPRYVGPAKAYELMLTGEPINGKEAVDLGLANKAVDEDSLLSEAVLLAEKIAVKSKPTIQQIMNLVAYTKSDQFSKGANEEAKAFGKIFGSEDAKEGINAFLEKRKPDFQDR